MQLMQLMPLMPLLHEVKKWILQNGLSKQKLHGEWDRRVERKETGDEAKVEGRHRRLENKSTTVRRIWEMRDEILRWEYLGLRIVLLNHINNHLIVDLARRRRHNMHELLLNINIYIFIPLFNSFTSQNTNLQSYGTNTNTNTDLIHDTEILHVFCDGFFSTSIRWGTHYLKSWSPNVLICTIRPCMIRPLYGYVCQYGYLIILM